MDSNKFATRYKQLNTAQKQAVDSIEGPVLVLAGPGTGKTELLSLRVANILKLTDIQPSNILCITFTDNAARNMRERLESILGKSAFHVSINTFHGLGSEIINNYPEYFTDRLLLQQIDELGMYELVHGILEGLPYSNLLATKLGDEFVYTKEIISAISWLKQAALSPNDLIDVVKANAEYYESINGLISETFKNSSGTKHIADYTKLLKKMSAFEKHNKLFGFPQYSEVCSKSFQIAVDAIDTNKRFAPSITAWRNVWCVKTFTGDYVLKDSHVNLEKIKSVHEVYKKLNEVMSTRGVYDFDDMIMEVVHAMEAHVELKYTLQERFQYILVDEFQDANKAQMRIVKALADNPVFEGKPNIMAVGDDDQSIYAFQGAEVSNMLDFSSSYSNVALISLTSSYRSTPEVLESSYSVAKQIDNRLDGYADVADKNIQSTRKSNNDSIIYHEFVSEISQYHAIAQEIKSLINNNVLPNQVCIIAPKHKYLERMVPFLATEDIPVAYERRENILEAPVIEQLITICKLLVALNQDSHTYANELLSSVLRFTCWEISTRELIDLSLKSYKNRTLWIEETTLTTGKIMIITGWLVELSRLVESEPLEYILDVLIGTKTLDVTADSFTSPIKDYYFNDSSFENSTDNYLSLLTQLSTLRRKLRNWQMNTTLNVKDFVDLASLYAKAHLKIINTNPHTESTNAVQVMTAYKAKGLEFDYVYVINLQDNVWGPTTRNKPNLIQFPKNLPIMPRGADDNDKLRLLFVAMTRAKQKLSLSSYQVDSDNKQTSALGYLDDTGLPKLIEEAHITTNDTFKILETDWEYRFIPVLADKATLFEPIINSYQLSITHLNNFIDVTKGGPRYFFEHNLLRFPESISPAAAYGDSVHKTLHWIHTELKARGKVPTPKQINNFYSESIGSKHLRAADESRLLDRGKATLEQYMANRKSQIVADDIYERSYRNEGVMIGSAKLTGKIDKVHLLDSHTVEVIDFKTGKPAISWQGKDAYEQVKLHKYKQQLLFYKLLIEGSANQGNRLSVKQGSLEFVETDKSGSFVDNLHIAYTTEDMDNFKLLITAVWNKIVSLDFPDVSQYSNDLKGIREFEANLIGN